jgi:hypothetical protein
MNKYDAVSTSVDIKITYICNKTGAEVDVEFDKDDIGWEFRVDVLTGDLFVIDQRCKICQHRHNILVGNLY